MSEDITPDRSGHITANGQIRAEGGAVYMSAESKDTVREAIVSVGGKIPTKATRSATFSTLVATGPKTRSSSRAKSTTSGAEPHETFAAPATRPRTGAS